MNIDEYRAMVAQEKAEQDNKPEGGAPDVQANESTTNVAEQTVQAPDAQGGVSQPNPTETDTPPIIEEIDVDGQKVPVEELRQGYLRQSDYTRKTQELAELKKQSAVAEQYYQAIHSDPEFAEGIARRFNLPFLTPEQAEQERLKNEVQQLRLERELESLKTKHGDIDVQKVLETAYQRRIPNLEDAVLLLKAEEAKGASAPDIDAIKKEIRQELLRELQSNVDTSTIIGTGGNTSQPIKADLPELSPDELRVAQGMGMTPQEYAKWKNMK